MNDSHTSPRAPLDARALLARSGLRAKKSWGQNFLCDDAVLADIAAATQAGPERPVVELGAGLGALTHHLLVRGGKVIAVERDREIVPVLRDNLAAFAQLEIREANAATLDYEALARELGGPLTVAGNLPYQLSSRIMVSLADAHPHVARAVLLVQREVAERLAAEPGSRTYGLLTVLVQRSFRVLILRSVPPGAFYPPPKIHSAVVVLQAHPERPVGTSDAQLVAAARAAFSARRKTLRNALAGGLGLTAPQLEPVFAEAGIDPGTRAETLGLAHFARLAAALAAHGLLPAAK